MPYKDPEKAREQMRRYRAANREQIQQKTREWRAANPERRADYDRRYAESDPERIRKMRREQRRRYVAANRERVNAAARDQQRQQRQADPDLTWMRGLKQRHGLRPEDWAALIAAQDGRCCYCERPLPEDRTKIHIDHDHTCTCGPDKSCISCRRGIACHHCNAIVGRADDDPDRLERVAANLRHLGADARRRINGKPAQAELFDINRAARRQEEESA